MFIFSPKETKSGETRAPLVPSGVKKLTSMGAIVGVESGIGEKINLADSDYRHAGASIFTDYRRALEEADMVLRMNPPTAADIAHMKPGSIHLSFLNPFNSTELIDVFCASKVSALSMEMIPRTTIAQKFDVLSSQASLAGYVAVVLAANYLQKIFPMMMTPAGTVSPARVFIIGAGVAGLQAIATAKRLGARVDAFDTRPVAAEQVQSLGAKFVKVDLGDTGQTKEGYALELTAEQLQKQQEAMAKVCEQSDIVITTAQIFGKKAPLIITEEMLNRMKPGSILVDMAVDTGGNIAGSVAEEVVMKNGVQIIGYSNLARRVPVNASEMYSNNLTSFIEHFWNIASSAFVLNPGDEIHNKCLITYQGEIFNSLLKETLCAVAK